MDAEAGSDHLSARLQAYARDALEEAPALEPTISGLAWGADAAGAMRAALNHDGALVAIRVDERWRSRLGHADLGAAVMEAVSAASQAIVAGRIEPASPATEATVTDTDTDTDATSARAEAHGREVLGAGRSPELAIRLLWDLLKDVESSMERVQAVAAGAATDEIEARSASGAVTATSRAGALVQVVCNRQWVRDASRQQVQHDLQQALVGAMPGHLRRVNAAVRGTGRVGELLDLAADPIRLIEALGLRGMGQVVGVRRAAA